MGAESESEDIGVECVDDVSGGESSPPFAGLLAYNSCAEKLPSTFSVKGRLKAKFFLEEGVTAPPLVLNIIESCSVLQWMSESTPFFGKIQLSTI